MPKTARQRRRIEKRKVNFTVKSFFQFLVMVPVLLLFFVFSFSFLVTPADASVGLNRVINFQGKIVNKTGGTNITDNTYSFTFKLYDAASSGNLLWQETQNSVSVTNGIFQVSLGSVTPFNGGGYNVDFKQNNLYLDITFNGETFGSRVQLAAVPQAINAEQLSGVVATQSATGFTMTGGTSTPKTLTLGDSTSLNTNAITFGGGESLTLAANKSVSFADAFTTSGANALTLTTTGPTNITLPTSGTLVNTGVTTLSSLTTVGSLVSGTVVGTDTFNSHQLLDSGALTLSTSSNGDLTLTPNGTGNTILTTTAVSGVKIGTSGNVQSVLSVSGGISNIAALIVNNTNSGDIIAASASGAPKFTIHNDGSIQTIGANGTADFTTITAGNGLTILPKTNASGAGGSLVLKGGNGSTTAGGITIDSGSGSSPSVTIGGTNATTITFGGSQNPNYTFSGSGTFQTSSGTNTLGGATNISGALTVTSTSTTAIAFGRQGSTSPAFVIDTSTNASSVTGLKIVAGAAGGGLALSEVGGNSNENLTLDAKGSGTITIGGTSTGNVNIGTATTGKTVQIGNSGSTADTIILGNSSDTALKLAKFSTQNGVLYISATDGTVAETAASTGTLCLQTAGSGTAPIWGGCAAAASALSGVTAATGNATISNGDNAITWNWAPSTAGRTNFTFGSTAAPASGTNTALAVNLTHTSNTETNGFLVNANGSGGTTTNGIQISQTAGTLTNGLTFSGTIGTEVNLGTVASGSTGISGTLANTTAANATGISLTTGTIATSGTQNAESIILGSAGSGTTASGINISVASNTTGSGTTNAITIAGLTTSNGTDTAITIGSGWDNAINANGNILIGAQADATSSYASLMSAAGTFGAQTSVLGATSSAVFKGKLFVATRKIDGAGVYRYDGGTTWTLVTHAAGQAVSGDTANIDGYSMVVYNGKLFIGSQTGQGTGTAAIYYSSDINSTTDDFTLVNTTRGRFVTNTGMDAVDDMEVVNGVLYAIGAKVNAGEVYRYMGGTGTSVFQALNNTAGKIVSGDAADFCGGVLQAYDGQLWIGVNTSSTTARVFEYEGDNGTAGAGWRLMNTTRGRFDTTTAMKAVTAMAVDDGSLFVAATKGPGTMELYRYTSGTSNGTPAVNVFNNINTAGKLDTSVDSTTVINAITVMKAYNGMFFIGTDTTAANGVGAVYQYDKSLSPNFTVVGTRGTFGSETNVDAVDSLIEYNNSLYIGTDEPSKGAVYSFTKTSQNSYMLTFDSGGGNYAGLGFEANTQADNHTGHDGSFFFTNSVALTTGAFDYAEDYPTKDDSLTAGDVVAIDSTTPQFVAKSGIGTGLIGVVSSNPGFDLQATADEANQARYVPVALVGRVPVNVSTENGSINAGDYLTSSSTTPGIAVKAINAGPVLGRAMENYDGTAVSQITVFVNVSYYDGVHNVAAGFSGDGAVLADMINEQTGSDQADTSSTATPSAVLLATPSAGIVPLANNLDGLSVANNATISGNLRVKGDGLIEGILSVIDTIVTKNILVNGTADFFSSVIFHNDIEFVGRPTFNQDTAGWAVIHSGADRVQVSFSQEYATLPVVAASFSSNTESSATDSAQMMLQNNYAVAVGHVSTKGFTIVLNKVATSDIVISWTAVAIDNPSTSESMVMPSVTLLQNMTTTPSASQSGQ